MNAYLKTLPNGAVYFQNTLNGQLFFPCDQIGNFQDITLNSLGNIEFIMPFRQGEIHSLDGFFKNVSDRLFRDLPKALVNVVTSPFTSAPIYKPEDFQNEKYGAAAGSERNNKIVGTGGKIAAAVILTPAAAAKFNTGGNTFTSFIQRNQSQGQAQMLPGEVNAGTPQNGFLDNIFPASVDPTTRKVIVFGGGGLLLATTLYFLLKD